MIWFCDLLIDAKGKIVAYCIHQSTLMSNSYCMTEDRELNNSLEREGLVLLPSRGFDSQEEAKAYIESRRASFHHTLD